MRRAIATATRCSTTSTTAPRARVKQVGDPNDYSNLGVWGEASVGETVVGVPDTGFLAEVGRTILTAPTNNAMAGLHVSKHLNSMTTGNDSFPPFSPTQAMNVGSTVDLRLDLRGGAAIRSSARLDNGAELLVLTTITGINPGRVGFRTYKMAAAFDYVVVVERRTALPCPSRN